MKRSAIALGASVLALAINAAPAAAQTGAPGQQIGDSAGAAQVGAADVDAPVRVLSDGENTAEDGGSSSAGSQDAADSTGAAQTGPAEVDAPVRVLSDGDNAGGETSQPGAGGAEQTADESNGSAQVEPANVSAPIRVLSDGDDGTTVTAADTTPDGGSPAGGDDTTGDTVPAIGGGQSDTTPAVDELPALDPVAEAEPGGDGGTLPDGDELLPVGDVAGDSAEGELPLTGLTVASLVLTGMALLAGGSGALHCVPGHH